VKNIWIIIDLFGSIVFFGISEDNPQRIRWKIYLHPISINLIPNPLGRGSLLASSKRYTKIWRKLGIKLARYIRTKLAFRISENLRNLLEIIHENHINTLVWNKAYMHITMSLTSWFCLNQLSYVSVYIPSRVQRCNYIVVENSITNTAQPMHGSTPKKNPCMRAWRTWA
jgi:hypothetical protein